MAAIAPICLIEDDHIMGESLKLRLELEGFECQWFMEGATASVALKRQQFSLIISDIKLPDISGEALYQEWVSAGLILPPILFITGFGTIDQAVRLINLGASDYITKPFDIDALIEKIATLIPQSQASDHHRDAVLGISDAMRQVEEQLIRSAQHPVPVLITGESGVGKEVAAKFYHQQIKERAGGEFIAINCAAFQESMLEAELFGYEKGAFTGAVKQHRGVFERAHLGTLFLDEVGEMPANMQVKLLRTLQERSLVRVGSEREIEVDVRIICATNRDLTEMVQRGEFREDLFYRLNVIHIDIPPLRERHEDILWLARRFIMQGPLGQGKGTTLTPGIERFLLAQSWNGNVRELQHAITRASIFSDGEQLDPYAFGCALNSQQIENQEINNLKEYIQRCERKKIRECLERHEWRVVESAVDLGISRKSLWEKMQRHHLAKPEEGQSAHG